MSDDLDAEDAKLVTLARATRARSGSAEGAAVRDETGRTYAASTVALPSLQLSALRLAVAMAVSSGADGLEAAAVVTESDRIANADLDAVREFGGEQTPILLADSTGEVDAVFRA